MCVWSESQWRWSVCVDAQTGLWLYIFAYNKNLIIVSFNGGCNQHNKNRSNFAFKENEARIFYLLIYGIFFIKFRVGGLKKALKWPIDNDQLTGHFRAFFFKYLQNKQWNLRKVSQQSVLNL